MAGTGALTGGFRFMRRKPSHAKNDHTDHKVERDKAECSNFESAKHPSAIGKRIAELNHPLMEPIEKWSNARGEFNHFCERS